ncbi:MAG: hypothetical protein K5766_01320 [Alphaproteobacteria bacterium]|nr:hypothetical protein [Alphaproteobacteria bacterium]MCR4555432.1 hypothetical protein [Alphaproteobacteria bacterium]
MGNKRDIVPVVIASAVALVVTGIIRWMIPSGSTIIKQQPLKKELSLPDIPLMIKSEQKKIKEIQVLVTSSEIKKDERILQSKLSWKSWPSNAVQPYFIAQDSKGNPLNNKDDYANALSMWAKNEIPAGIPLTLSMLTRDDPVEIARRKKEAEEAEKAKQAELEKKKEAEESTIKKGYRAVTFQVDQRTPISSSMITQGDYVDVIINSLEGGVQRTYNYKALRILAIDGVTKQPRADKGDNKGIFGIGGSSTPRNITLEVKGRHVNDMLKQAGNNGITIIIRGKDEKIEEDFVEEDSENKDSLNEDNSSNADDSILIKGLWEIGKTSSAEMLKESVRKRQEEESNISALLHNMSNFGAQTMPKGKERDSSSEDSSKYEVVSGRIVSESNKSKDKKKEDSVKIYRKLTSDEVQFQKDDKKIGNNEDDSAKEGK